MAKKFFTISPFDAVQMSTKGVRYKCHELLTFSITFHVPGLENIFGKARKSVSIYRHVKKIWRYLQNL